MKNLFLKILVLTIGISIQLVHSTQYEIKSELNIEPKSTMDGLYRIANCKLYVENPKFFKKTEFKVLPYAESMDNGRKVITYQRLTLDNFYKLLKQVERNRDDSSGKEIYNKMFVDCDEISIKEIPTKIP